VTWLRAVAEELNLNNASVHLAVYLLDIFMDNHKIVEERLKLVALVCILLAGLYMWLMITTSYIFHTCNTNFFNWLEGIKKAMDGRILKEGQWEDREQWSLGVGQHRKTFQNWR
jgi:hypothetical protein